MSKSLRRRLPWVAMTGLILVGLALSSYLTVLHIKVFTQASYAADSSVCSISEKVNCEQVAENPYSIFLGVPVSVWGMVGYLFMLIGAIAGLRTPRNPPRSRLTCSGLLASGAW